MKQKELDSLLQVIENPVRRKMIKRLSQGPTHAFQLAKELGFGQPLIAKHLAILKEAGLVDSVKEISPTGPRRKRYSLAKSVSITMDVAPNLFMEKGVALEPRQTKEGELRATGELRKRVRGALETGDDRERLSALSDALNDIDERISEIEVERADLLQARNQAMQGAANIANKLEQLDMRRVLFHILDAHEREVNRISESLNLRELTVKRILEELEDEYFG